MLAVTDEPDAPREAGPPDHDYGGSGWLASALSGSQTPGSPQGSAASAPHGQDAPPDGDPRISAAGHDQPDETAHAGSRREPRHKHLARRLRRRHDRSAADDAAQPGEPHPEDIAQPGGLLPEPHAAQPGQARLEPHAAGHEPAGRHQQPHADGHESADQAHPEPPTPGERPRAHPHGPAQDGGADHPEQPQPPHGPAPDAGADDSEQPLSPLGAPPLPATPTGVVRWWTAGATVAAAALLSVAAFAGVGPLAAAALLVVAVTAWGWPTLVDLPSPRGSTTTVALGGAACVAAVALSRHEPLLQWLALALAGAVVAEFVHQLLRRDGRPRLVECVTGTLAGVVVLASMSALLALPRTPVEGGGVLLVVIPAAIGLSLQALPVPGRLASLAGVGVAALLAGLAASFLEPTVLAGLVTGLVAGAVAIMLHRLLSVLPPAGSAPAWLALALAPLASTGMVGYVALRLLVG
jgi:hypothetical protein